MGKYAGYARSLANPNFEKQKSNLQRFLNGGRFSEGSNLIK